MKRLLTVLFCISLIAPGLSHAGSSKINARVGPQHVTLPEDLAGYYGPMRSAAAADTFVLLEEDFDSSNGDINNLPSGWSTNDITDQLAIFWHVADGTELSGGTLGNLLPLAGSKSMWCGVAASTAVPYCGYTSLPGYGNGWDQILESSLLPGDSISLGYKVFWDSEPAYDVTVVEYSFDGGSTWHSFPITDTLSTRALVYDGVSLAPFIAETVTNQVAGTTDGNVKARFRFTSGETWSDEDGLWPTDGAIIVDDITLQTWAGGGQVTNNTESFEGATTGSNVAGLWTGTKAPAFGDFAALYAGVSLTQEDPCLFNPLFMWGFFDDHLSTAYDCHTPNPLPGQGAMPFGTDDGIYMWNEVWSPAVPNIGSGLEYRLRFLVYKDLPLDNLQFFVWRVRSWFSPTVGPLCPGPWRSHDYVYYGGHRFWTGYRDEPYFLEDIGDIVDAGADAIQVAIGAIDMCGLWCNIYGTGACHSHAPLVDEWRLERIATFGPQFGVRHIDLFQDNFAGDGTLTGTARADAAQDILPASSPSIQPGDSVAMWISPVHAPGGSGPSAWLYARVHNGNAPKSGAGLGSPNTRTGIRWPHAGSWTDDNSNVWEIFQMDSVFKSTGVHMPDKYCVDLNDALFVPGDTILYFFGADADGTSGNGNENYWHRTLDGQGDDNRTADREEAAASPCEFMILPAGGYNRGGDILYVDDTDDRGGPAQLFFDSSFDMLGIREKVDRFDVLSPSSQVGNSLASRVTSNINQIINIYRKIIWNSGNLEAGLIGDGSGWPEKSDDFGLLEEFIRTSALEPGLYISGDDIAEEWVTLGGAGAVLLKTSWIPFNLLDGDHINFGEAMSPILTATSTAFSGQAFVGYGGCSIVNNFDVLEPTGISREEFPYPLTSTPGTTDPSAVISAQGPNAQTTRTYTIVLSGLSYHYIRDATLQFPPARVEHLHTILTYMGNIVPEATGVPGDGPQFANYLDTNYPNPFNPTTKIRYGVKEQAHVSLKVYNVAGQLIRTLVDGVQKPAAEFRVDWHGDNDAGQTVASGVYFYRLVTKEFSKTRKMVLLK